MGPALFALGCLMGLWSVAAVSVYGFGFIEPMWGYWGSFFVLAIFAVGCAFFASVSFGIVSALSRRFATNLQASLLGVASSLFAIGILALTNRHFGSGLGNIAAFGVFVLVAGFVPFTVRRQGG